MKPAAKFVVVAVVPAALVLGVVASPAHAQAPDEEGWVSLFNGEDLTGWLPWARQIPSLTLPSPWGRG